VGLHLSDAIRALSSDSLNVRILAEKEDPDLHEGMILSQTPKAGTFIKPHQSLFLVITRKPLNPQAPTLLGSSLSQAQLRARNAGITLRTYTLENPLPQDIVIAQSVLPQRDVEDGTITIYNSKGSTPLKIFPQLKGKSVDEVVAFFGLYDIPVTVTGERSSLIKDQRPLAGMLIDISKPLVVQVTTE
jgi:serine/threonine-protein kinase